MLALCVGLLTVLLPGQLSRHVENETLTARNTLGSLVSAQCRTVEATAQALAAGIPQLILPMAWDQPDNARRVKRLGAGHWLLPNSSGVRMASALAGLMTPETRTRCRAIAASFGNGDPFEIAAQWIEKLVH